MKQDFRVVTFQSEKEAEGWLNAQSESNKVRIIHVHVYPSGRATYTVALVARADVATESVPA